MIATVGFSDAEARDFEDGLGTAQDILASAGCTVSWEVQHYEFDLAGLTSLREALHTFAALIVFPRLPTWSRLPSLNRLGPRPMRSAAFPWGLPWLTNVTTKRVDKENTLLRMVLNIFGALPAQGSADGPRQISPASPLLMLLQPEDLGPLPNHHPASLWQLREIRGIARALDLQRSAFHQCRHQRDDHSRPTGILHSCELLGGTAKRGWPRIPQTGEDGPAYRGPLTKTCGCGGRHVSMLRCRGQFRSPSRVLAQGTCALLAATTAAASTSAQTQGDGLLWQGIEQALLKAVTPGLLRYFIDSDGYDTDATAFLDPPESGDDDDEVQAAVHNVLHHHHARDRHHRPPPHAALPGGRPPAREHLADYEVTVPRAVGPHALCHTSHSLPSLLFWLSQHTTNFDSGYSAIWELFMWVYSDRLKLTLSKGKERRKPKGTRRHMLAGGAVPHDLIQPAKRRGSRRLFLLASPPFW